jgi:hypothetical protein
MSLMRLLQDMTTSGLHFERTRTKLVSPSKTKENKEAFEFNLETLRGLSMRDP